MKCGFFSALCLTGFLFFASPSFGESTLSPEALPVHSITIQVVGEAGADQELLKTLSTKERERFSQAEFDKDLKLIAKEYDRVEPSVSVVNGEVVVALKVWKKPVIQEIIWKGNQAIEKDALQKELGIAHGAIYDRPGFNKAIQKVRQYYVKKGFFESDIDYKLVPVEGSPNTVNIEISVSEGKAGLIERIRFHGFTRDEAEELGEKLMTKEYSFWLSWLTSQGTYYKDVFRQDEHTVLTYLQNKGLLDAKVTCKITPSSDRSDRIIVDITAERGKVYRLGKMSAMGNTIFPEKTLIEKTGVQPGDKYSPQAIATAAKNISDLYGSKGYIDANVIPEPKLRDGERVYDVAFKIEEGTCFRVGMIQIIGNTRTDASLILHETLLVPGAIFDSTLLAKTEERLRNIGYFKSVNAYAVKSATLSSGEAHFRDVHIEVEEVPTTARFTAGFGWNSSEGLGGTLSVSDTNFRVAGIPRLFSQGLKAVRGAGEYASVQTTIGTKMFSYGVSWTKPFFLDTKWVLGVDYTKERNAYAWNDYTIHSSEATVTGSYALNALWTFGTHYRIRDADIHLGESLRREKNKSLVRESKIGGVLSAVGVSLNYDTTNHPVIPTKGYRSSMLTEYAGIGGDHHFLSLGYLNSVFFSPFGKGIWKFRADAHTLQPVFGSKPSHIPMVERLYLGGEQTVRGFRYNALGPNYGDKDKTPRGGMSSLLLSGEYEHPLWKKLNGFMFCDAGNVWWRPFTAGPIKITVGYGIHFYIFEAAPLTIGMGYPLNNKCKRDEKRFFFSLGVNF
jgi:outer membrane protein insertion porin family